MKTIELKKLGDVCDIVGGGTPSKKREDYYGGDIPWATVRDMNNDLLDITEHQITEVGLKNSSANIIPKNNVVIATRVGLGKVCLLSNDTAINQDLKGIIPKRQKSLLPEYLFLWFKSISQKIVDAGTGATVQGVKIPFVKELQIPIPPLPEQQRIVAILDEAFEAIDQAKANVERNIHNAEELFQSKLNEVFSQRGEGWEEKKLSDICEYDKTKKTKSDLPYVGMEDIESNTGRFLGELEPREMKSSTFQFDSSHVLYGRLRPYLNKVLLPDFEGHCSTEIFPIKTTNEVKRKYLFYWFINSNTVNKIDATSTGARMPRANMKEVLNFSIPVPSIESQFKVIQQLDSLLNSKESICQNYQSYLNEIDELKKSILLKAFSGELTANEEVAA